MARHGGRFGRRSRRRSRRHTCALCLRPTASSPFRSLNPCSLAGRTVADNFQTDSGTQQTLFRDAVLTDQLGFGLPEAPFSISKFKLIFKHEYFMHIPRLFLFKSSSSIPSVMRLPTKKWSSSVRF